MKLKLGLLLNLLNILSLLNLLAAPALALTVVNRYVTTDCANNGNGTAASCAASSGAAGAYTTMQNALDDITADNANFVSADIQVTVHAKGTAADTSEPDITGLTVDATRYLILTADSADRHDGKWNTSKYRIVNGSYYGAVRIRIPFARIIGLQVENNRTGSEGGTKCNGIMLSIGAVTAGKIVVTDNLVRSTGDLVNCVGNGIADDWQETSGVTKVYTNNVVWDWNIGVYIHTSDGAAVYVYNNTAYSNVASSTCFEILGYGSSPTLHYKNNLAQGSCAGYYIESAGYATHANNLSEDTTSPDDTWDSKVVTFVNEAGDDYHLAVADANAKDQGADLSAVTEGFSTDIDGQARSGTWDIGADEYLSSGSAVPALLNLGF